MYDINYDVESDIDPDFKITCLQCNTVQPINAREADEIAKSTGVVKCVACNDGITIRIRGVVPKHTAFDTVICLEDWV